MEKGQEELPIIVILDTPQKREDMLRLCQRGLNTWDFPPAWIRELHDRIARRSAYPPLPPFPANVATVKRSRPVLVSVDSAGNVEVRPAVAEPAPREKPGFIRRFLENLTHLT